MESKHNKPNPRLNSLWIFLAIALIFCSCENREAFAPKVQDTTTSSARKELSFLSFKNTQQALHKKKSQKKWVTRANGGKLNLAHGTASRAAGNLMYGNSKRAPYKIYRIDPHNLSQTTVAGRLAFASRAIAMHPATGLLYYVGVEPVNGVFPVATWDPETNTNTILPNGSSFRPAAKLAFGPDGTLYGVKRNRSKRLYTIDTTTGKWTLFRVYNSPLHYRGDFAFDPEGTFYNINAYTSALQIIDLESNHVTTVGTIGPDNFSGLCSGNKGQLYATTRTGRVGKINKHNAFGRSIGSAGVGRIDDLAPVFAHRELTYAEISLEIPPGSISEDAEVEISIETTEIVGGIGVTFQPHGVTFNSPAALNIVAHGVDLTGVSPDEVNIYYDNPETGLWEPMEKERIIVDIHNGIVQVLNALIPHFSRYALSKD